MDLIPPLSWVPSFCDSISRAIDEPVTFIVLPTANPLIFNLKMSFSQTPKPSMTGKIWNILQAWAAKNDSYTHGGWRRDKRVLEVCVGVKRLLGKKRDDKPN